MDTIHRQPLIAAAHACLSDEGELMLVLSQPMTSRLPKDTGTL